MDYGPKPYTTNISRMAAENQNFRSALWTGSLLQMTLMCIAPCGEIGWEMHADTDQFIRIEQGTAVVCMGDYEGSREIVKRVDACDGIFVPAGTWHNVKNAGKCPLRVSSIYAPPHHRRGTVQN